MAKNKNQEAKKGGAPNKGSLQAYIQNFTKEAIDAVIEIMRTSRNEALRFGAAKLVIDKSIADIRAVELTGENNGPITIKIISETNMTYGDRTSNPEFSQATANL